MGANGRLPIRINVGVEEHVVACSHTTGGETCACFNTSLTWFCTAALEEGMHEKCVHRIHL